MMTYDEFYVDFSEQSRAALKSEVLGYFNDRSRWYSPPSLRMFSGKYQKKKNSIKKCNRRISRDLIKWV